MSIQKVSDFMVDPLSYDIGFSAGFDSDMLQDDVEAKAYGKVIMCRAGSFMGESGYVETAPTGAALIVDIEKNSASIYTTKPEFAIGSNTLTAGVLKTDNTEDFAAGDRITFKVTQIGSTVAGKGLTFSVKGIV